jgi:hypothetical protein
MHCSPSTGTETLYKAAAVWQNFHIVTQDVVADEILIFPASPRMPVSSRGKRLNEKMFTATLSIKKRSTSWREYRAFKI